MAITAGSATRGRRLRRLVVLAASVVVAGGALQPAAAAEPAPWEAASPGVFGMGDSLFRQCGETLGLGTRSLGMVGWPSATTEDLRARMTSAVEDWPFSTENSHAEELAGIRDAGTWVVGLGTNDVTRLTADRYRTNVAWFMEQAGGRPVLWFTIHHPGYPAKVATFNGILQDAAALWPNLRLLDWRGHVAAHPELLAGDRVHIASYDACRQGRFALIQAAAPPVHGQQQSSAWTDPAPQPPPSPDPVTTEHERAGGATGPLGAPTGELGCLRRADGCARFFAAGAIAWSPATGVHVLPAPAATAWRTYAEASATGYPVGGAVCGLRDGGCRQQVEMGWLYWSSRTAAFQVTGPVLSRYLARGAEGGQLGYPTSGMPCGLVRVGCVQHFTGGSVFWSATTGARAVMGAIAARHRSGGAENGALGYPTIDTTCIASGCGQHFTGGSIYWTSSTGARAVTGRIRTRWLALGGAQGRLGYPVTEQSAISGGVTQRFQGGTLTWRNGRWV